MKYYLISYDLKASGGNYSSLYEAIKSFGDCRHPMESMWVVRTDDSNTAVAIREKLKEHLQSGDVVFVVNITDSEYAGWLASSFWEWYKKYNQ